MITLRCTKKLRQHLGVKPEADELAPSSLLGDWYGNLIYHAGPPLLLITNERSLLSVVLRHDADLLNELRQHILGLLRRLGLPPEAVERESFHLRQIRIGKTRNRRVLGSMNDAALQLEVRSPAELRGPLGLLRAEDALARNLYTMLDYALPAEVAFELLTGEPAPGSEDRRPRAGAAQPAGSPRSGSPGGHERPAAEQSTDESADEPAQTGPRHPAAPLPPALADLLRGAHSDHAQLQRLRAILCDLLPLPAPATVVGQRVELVDLVYLGQPRRGLVARCRRGGRTHSVSLADVRFPPASPGEAVGAIYQQWLAHGTAPEPSAAPAAEPITESSWSASLSAESSAELPAPAPSAASSTAESSAAGPPKADLAQITPGEPVELVLLACKATALRCRLPGSEQQLTLRTAVRDEVPGEIITVHPRKRWTHARHPYVSGVVESSRLEPEALGLTPLALHPQGDWNPEDDYWGEPDEPIEPWAQPIIARGVRPAFEMQQLIPGEDPEDIDSDPILEAVDLSHAGRPDLARELLMNLLAQDLRCLDAHAHLGNLELDHRPQTALRHYAVGVGIGSLSLGPDFDGVLLWGMIDNRPYLRCLHGLALAHWRLGQPAEALASFTRMLWLNPRDNQGARFNLAALQDGRSWEEMRDE